MKKLTRLLCLGAIAFFVLVGPAAATPVTYDFYHPFQGNLWAELTALDPVNTGSGYTYQYTLENVGLSGQSIHRLDLQIGAYTTISFTAVVGEPLLVVPPPATPGGKVYFMWDELAPGESSTFGFTVDLAPGIGTATLWNTGATTNECVSTAVVAYDGGAGRDPVPEPATLLLIGSGLLGMAGAKRFKRSRKS